MQRNVWLTLILTFGIVACAWGQQSATPQPASGDNRPLDATMQFLQAQLNEPGKLNWTTHYHDNADNANWAYTFSFEITHVVADAAACNIGYHFLIVRDGVAISDKDTQFNLHDVRNVALTTGDERQAKNDVAAGHPTWSAQVIPPVFDLIVQGKENAEYYFFMTDQQTASRVTQAMNRAVELCGGRP